MRQFQVVVVVGPYMLVGMGADDSRSRIDGGRPDRVDSGDFGEWRTTDWLAPGGQRAGSLLSTVAEPVW